jgi:hypothetical protein
MAKKKFEQCFYEPYMQVRNSCLLFYQLPTKKSYHTRKAFTQPTYSGTVTTHAQKRIRKAVDILLQGAPKRKVYNPISGIWVDHTLSFITLTIPGGCRHLTAKEGHSLLLEKWIRKMRTKYQMTTYLWKAELQKNGQLHYHITTPAWILYTNIRDTWNNLLSDAGLLKEYLSEHNNQMPNSTDVHAVYKIRNIHSYLVKYLSKEDKDSSTQGKVWDCSLNIKKAKFFSIPEPGAIYQTIDRTKVIVKDYIGIFNHKHPAQILPPVIKVQYQNYLTSISTPGE